jgi:asparagine synthase (glutamine-hydrolysing)
MCGIAGYWGVGNREILEAMNSSLTHRGPDAGGIHIAGNIGLAHRRLSILDLSPAGSQPMCNDTGDVTLVFNGEIYNFNELKREFLEDRIWRGTSDTEVLLYLYEKLGEHCFEKIRGMFAIAIHDARSNTLILARDHLGKKPLYWSLAGDTLIFGSELKALRKHPLCPTALNTDAVAQYLMYEYIPSPGTIYTNVQKVSPGTLLTYDGVSTTEHSFSDINFDSGVHEEDSAQAQTTLYSLLEKAVTKRMVADVPVGVFLSGGLDSSTVAYFAQKNATHRVKTFSIGFDNPDFDESEYARRVAQVLGTDHFSRTVTASDLLALLTHIPEVLDEPMADSSIVPTLLLSEFARSEVKVALGGDGADELFWGYGTFLAHRVGLHYEKVPRTVQKMVTWCAEQLPVSHGYMSLDFKIKKFLSGFEITRARRNTYWLGAFTREELDSLLTFPINDSTLFGHVDALYAGERSFWDGVQSDYMSGYLAEDILVKTDRASMAHGLEVRAPFLDLDIVHFASTLHPHMKLRGTEGKWILKKVMREHLPKEVIARQKKGFGIPIGAWIQGELREMVTSTLLGGHLVASGLFNREVIAILLESHMSGKVDNRKKIWTLLMLELWMEEWHGNKS